MASILNATTTNGLVTSADNSGSLQLQTNNGTTAVTIDTSQNVGIGTTSPNNYANYKTLTLNGTSGGVVDFSVNGTLTGEVFSLSNEFRNQAVGASTNYTIFTNGSERMRIPAAGGVQAVTCVSVGNATPAASGAGITFPATQSASTDANTLDDYEEGTWTGTITGSVANPTTPVTATGTYTKIGRQVLARIGYNDVNTTGASGSLGVSGLPFTSGASTATGSVMFYSIGTGFSTANNISPYIPSTNTVFFYGMVNAGIWSIVTHNPGTARYLYFSVTYEV